MRGDICCVKSLDLVREEEGVDEVVEVEVEDDDKVKEGGGVEAVKMKETEGTVHEVEV